MGIPVLVHSDHCAKKLLPWFDGMLEADKAFFEAHGEPLFSSHMLDLSEEPDEVNISICAEYLKKMAPMKLILEMEIGITGGVEDGVDNSGVAKDKLYSTPEDVYQVWTTLSPISEKFTIAAAFGNVHGVYKPGNVVLQPELLDSFQKNFHMVVMPVRVGVTSDEDNRVETVPLGVGVDPNVLGSRARAVTATVPDVPLVDGT